MMSSKNAYIAFPIFFILLSHFSVQVHSGAVYPVRTKGSGCGSAVKIVAIFLIIVVSRLSGQIESVAPECGVEENGGCIDKKAALQLKIIAIVAILVTSMIGVCLPLVTRSVKALSPERNLFVVVKAFAAGIILGTGFMHVLPDSFEMLWSSCLPEKPWRNFSFTGLVAMFSAIITLTIDSLATSINSQKQRKEAGLPESQGAAVEAGDIQPQVEGMKVLRFRVVAMVLEVGGVPSPSSSSSSPTSPSRSTPWWRSAAPSRTTAAPTRRKHCL